MEDLAAKAEENRTAESTVKAWIKREGESISMEGGEWENRQDSRETLDTKRKQAKIYLSLWGSKASKRKGFG